MYVCIERIRVINRGRLEEIKVKRERERERERERWGMNESFI